MDILLNGKFLCDSQALYGSRAEGEMGGHGHGSSKEGSAQFEIKTIAGMTRCLGPYPVKKGDTITLVAEYDLSKHPL
jgi:hypothetical protein